MNLERLPSTVVRYPAWLRGWCLATAAVTFGLIAFGTLVTTFHVGMSDPLWPTAPWHLLLIDRLPNFGFYIEHTHRIAGYLAGTFILVETLALWWYTPNWGRRLAAFAALVGVSAGTTVGMYLVKHAPERAIQSLLNPGFFLAAASALAFLGLAFGEVMSQTAGRWHRAIVTVAFVGVVAQGMLGGLRVYLNELIGPNLAIVHGLFAEVLFASTALLAVMSGSRWNSMIDLVTERPLRICLGGDRGPGSDSDRFWRLVAAFARSGRPDASSAARDAGRGRSDLAQCTHEIRRGRRPPTAAKSRRAVGYGRFSGGARSGGLGSGYQRDIAV